MAREVELAYRRLLRALNTLHMPEPSLHAGSRTMGVAYRLDWDYREGAKTYLGQTAAQAERTLLGMAEALDVVAELTYRASRTTRPVMQEIPTP